jgi:hypothetical protein
MIQDTTNEIHITETFLELLLAGAAEFRVAEDEVVDGFNFQL